MITKAFSSVVNIAGGVRQLHNGRSVQYACIHCGSYSTASIDLMVDHCKTCTSMPRPDAFRCKYVCCQCTYDSNSSVRYNCSHCGVYSTLLLDEMILHCKTCTSMPRPDAFRCKFVCNVCPYGAYSNQAIRNHILSHTGEKPYACSYCSYACAHKSNLNKHVRTTHRFM
ncbi:hypothetical protein M8J76_013655 [Diaphorina citri]|nr:hypothetical protein M8J76_013655 [Diaphorina citri]